MYYTEGGVALAVGQIPAKAIAHLRVLQATNSAPMFRVSSDGADATTNSICIVL